MSSQTLSPDPGAGIAAMPRMSGNLPCWVERDERDQKLITNRFSFDAEITSSWISHGLPST
jgi:hypothetical protein